MAEPYETAAVLEVVRAETAAFYARDFEEIAKYWLHDENIKVIVSGPVVGTRITLGWQQLSERMREGIRLFPAKFDFSEYFSWENIYVDVAGGMAWVSYDQLLLKSHELMLAPPVQHETKILKLQNGNWQLTCLNIAAPAIKREDVPRIELNGDGLIFGVNEIAKDRLGSHPGLIISGKRVRARNRDFDLFLQKEIQRIISHQKTHLLPGLLRETVVAVPLGTDEASRPLYCWVTLEQERIIISFDDDFLMMARINWAASVYGLSPTQKQMASALAAGLDLAGIATSQSVSINTVRTQLRRMFTKTGTNNQVALISVLLSVQRPL